MTRPLRIYVAGPYSGDVEANVARARDAGTLLLDLGCSPFVPHNNHEWDARSPRPYERWMDWCLSWVPLCDALLRLHGESAGADREVALAMELGMPVLSLSTVSLAPLTVYAVKTWARTLKERHA